MRCAIIGGGFSGTAVAIALLRTLPPSHAVTIYEPSDDLGRGIAYAKGPDHHLLNIAAHTVAVAPDHDETFCEWCVRRFPDAARYREDDGAYFFPREWFGTYMHELVGAAVASSKGVTLTHDRSVVQSVRYTEGKVIVRSSSGESAFDRVVFAVGNGPISPIRVLESSKCPIVEQSGWKFNAKGIQKSARVAVIGSGLTMADVVAELDAHGHQGSIVCISRNGRRPLNSVGYRDEFTPTDTAPVPATARLLVHAVRGWTAEAADRAGHWIPGVDYVIRQTPALWRALPPIERTRLRRHARSIWEIHRYKMPPAAHRRVQALISAGRFTHLKAYVQGVVPGGVRVRASNGVCDIPADIIVNASGFDTSYRTALAPLPALLEDTGLSARDVARDGLAVDDRGCLLGGRSDASGVFYALGFLARANHGDMGTVHIIGAVAEGIAEHMRNQWQM